MTDNEYIKRIEVLLEIAIMKGYQEGYDKCLEDNLTLSPSDELILGDLEDIK